MVERGYSKKPVLLGQSRGGLMMLCWAFRNPDKVQAFAGIYPVCNLADWPVRNSMPAVLKDYGLSEAAFMEQMDGFNPLKNLAELAAKGVPMFTVHGDSDKKVPCSENSARLKEAYGKEGGTIEVKVIPGQWHNGAPEFFKDQDLLDFLITQATRDAANNANNAVSIAQVDESTLHAGFVDPAPEYVPRSLLANVTKPQLKPANHYHQWVDAGMGNGTCSADFEYAAPLTTGVLLGVVGNRFPGQTLQWDGDAMRFTNNEDANKLVSRSYRTDY